MVGNDSEITDKTFSSRDRLLTLIEIMQRYSDEDNSISLREIIEYFPSSVTLNPATVRADLNALSKSDIFKISSSREQNGLESRYWYEGIGLKLSELRMLLDAVVAARFIPVKETRHLMEQLKRFAGKHITEEMDNQIFVTDEPGVAIKEISDSIQLLHLAVHRSRVIQFQY